MAKLVAATCPKCGAHVQLDPDREFVTCQFCGASSFVQTQRRPVTQQIVAQQMPVIHVPHAQKGCASALVLMAVLGGVGAGIAGALISFMSTASVAPTAPLGTVSLPGTATPGAASEPPPPASPLPAGPRIEEDYFADGALVKARYEAALGQPVLAKDLVIYQYYAILEAQNPKNRQHVDSYKLWASKVERPKAVRLGSDKPQLGALLFSLSDVDFTRLPRLIKQALVDLQLEDGKVTHVILERDSGGKREPLWRVYVNGSRDSAFVEFSLAGEKRRVAK